ncbi:MAG TPA: ATP-binding protein [Candidatus Hydrogenedentes bacterium]|nr:ATP-binding protein [Candidatus Hydrogenedentota bacterium]HRK34491.1 ATP-binding protein [Candidatus Hydrogenedentota bacterium]
MAKPFFASDFESTMEALGVALKSALRALVERGWVESGQTFYAQLCLEEALVNAVDHGNERDPSKRVRIEISEEGDTCVIRVYDQGGGFSPSDIHLPELEQMNGRGICLIRYCMEAVAYDNETNCLEMRMRRNAACPKEG